MKILFMGTPDYAAECLKALHNHKGVDICAVVTQPDKPKGRGMKMIFPPVKEYALEAGLPVYQPTTLKDGSFEKTLKELAPELIIVAAYGKILPNYIIDYPQLGCVNAHASLLPRHRGAAPINRAIMAGDKKTGVCAMYMDYGLDTGDVLLSLECDITDTDDAGTLHDKLAALAAKAMCEAVDRLADKTAERTPQAEVGMTYAAKITKEDCHIDWSHSAEEIYNQIRGLAPAPCAFTHTPDGKLLKVTGAVMCDKTDSTPGKVLSLSDGITVACRDKSLTITGVIPEGKGRMSAEAFINGRKISAGDVLA